MTEPIRLRPTQEWAAWRDNPQTQLFLQMLDQMVAGVQLQWLIDGFQETNEFNRGGAVALSELAQMVRALGVTPAEEEQIRLELEHKNRVEKARIEAENY
jgi:hypothetical protein